MAGPAAEHETFSRSGTKTSPAVTNITLSCKPAAANERHLFKLWSCSVNDCCVCFCWEHILEAEEYSDPHYEDVHTWVLWPHWIRWRLARSVLVSVFVFLMINVTSAQEICYVSVAPMTQENEENGCTWESPWWYLTLEAITAWGLNIVQTEAHVSTTMLGSMVQGYHSELSLNASPPIHSVCVCVWVWCGTQALQ